MKPDDVVDDDWVRLLQEFVEAVGNVGKLHSFTFENLQQETQRQVGCTTYTYRASDVDVATSTCRKYLSLLMNSRTWLSCSLCVLMYCHRLLMMTGLV